MATGGVLGTALAGAVPTALAALTLDEATVTFDDDVLAIGAALAVDGMPDPTASGAEDALVTGMSAAGCAWWKSRNAMSTTTTVASASATPTMPLRNRVACASGVEIVVFIGDDGDGISSVVSTVAFSTSIEPGSVTSRITAGFGGRVSWPFSSARGGAA